VRDEIELWMRVLVQYNLTDWMIVLVETYDFRKTNKLLPRTTVLDKIKSDFGAMHAARYFSEILKCLKFIYCTLLILFD
jgi:hypothetical protein